MRFVFEPSLAPDTHKTRIGCVRVCVFDAMLRWPLQPDRLRFVSCLVHCARAPQLNNVIVMLLITIHDLQ